MVELMTVVVIIGILAVVAVPSYKKYILQTKLAEAYSLLGELKQKQIAYFHEFNHFIHMPQNPPQASTSMVVEEIPSAGYLGPIVYPAPIGTQTYFSYQGYAGKVLANGTTCTGHVCGGTGFTVPESAYPLKIEMSGGGSTCNNTNLISELIPAPTPSYDWSIISAVADLNNNNANEQCSAIYMVIHASPATERAVVSTPPINLWIGE